MSVEEKNVDVFELIESRDRPTVFMHGCNMQGEMGSGVAKQVRSRWPGMYLSYNGLMNGGGKSFELGDIISRFVENDPPLAVVNALTQEHYGRDGGIYADHLAIKRSIIRTTSRFDNEWNFVSVKVGCGLGGLDWSDVKPIFRDSKVDWTICYL